MSLRAVVGGLSLVLAAGVGPGIDGDAARAAAVAETGVAARTSGVPPRPAVVERRVIGRTVQDRPVRAWRLGDPGARVTAVAIAAMHGDETAPMDLLEQLRDGRPVTGVDLWVVPVVNPDGVLAGRRANANGVDLNRNFPREWTDLDGEVESGTGPASEPETRALMRFLRQVDPRFVVSFHQPLHGIDVHGPKKRWFARRLADSLRLPRREFACGSSCHGTFTQWFNHRFEGVAVTVEYGRDPSWQRMNVRAPRQLLRALGGSR
jgi:predicted deacylase